MKQKNTPQEPLTLSPAQLLGARGGRKAWANITPAKRKEILSARAKKAWETKRKMFPTRDGNTN